MKSITFFASAFILSAAFAVTAQRPPQGPPGAGHPPRAEGPGGLGGDRAPRGPRDGGEWFKAFDTNKDQKLDSSEIDAAANATFDALDRDQNGTLDASEIRPPRPEAPPAVGQLDGSRDGARAPKAGQRAGLLPPFFFMKGEEPEAPISRAEFNAAVRNSFAEMDKNNDGTLSREEARPPHGDHMGPMAPPPPPNAQFIGAEMRFGDKLVKGQPFSAETIVEDNRRLFDGTAVSKQSRGAFYRDSAGRTRREQPLDNVGGFSVVGDNAKPQMLVFINDFAAKTQYFLDLNNKVARKSPVDSDMRPPRPNNDGPEDAKTESLGTRTIEGVACEGTRTTFEIPVGQIGNSKPIQVVTEKWFSPELQAVVMSRHTDPLAGEHVFKLVNIRRAEPAADLFAVPAGFKTEEHRAPRRNEE